MISDDFETFIDNNLWHGQTKTKILVQKIIHFIKIQNIHSNKIFIFLKFRIFIQTKYSFFFKKGRIVQGYVHVHLGRPGQHSPEVSPNSPSVKKSPIDQNYLTYDMVQAETWYTWRLLLCIKIAPVLFYHNSIVW